MQFRRETINKSQILQPRIFVRGLDLAALMMSDGFYSDRSKNHIFSPREVFGSNSKIFVFRGLFLVRRNLGKFAPLWIDLNCRFTCFSNENRVFVHLTKSAPELSNFTGPSETANRFNESELLNSSIVRLVSKRLPYCELVRRSDGLYLADTSYSGKYQDEQQ